MPRLHFSPLPLGLLGDQPLPLRLHLPLHLPLPLNPTASLPLYTSTRLKICYLLFVYLVYFVVNPLAYVASPAADGGGTPSLPLPATALPIL